MRLPYKGTCRITKLYGTKPPAGVTYKYGYHTGIDMVGVTDKTIVSCEAGKVLANGYDKNGWGYYVKIKGTKSGLTFIYCHMAARSALVVGKSVVEGATVGKEGATGQVTGAHLHLEIRKDPDNGSTAINPCTVLEIKDQIGAVEKEEEEMTEAEIRKIISEELKKIITGSGNTPSTWAKPEWDKGKALGITDGTRPQGLLTREQGISMIVRALNK